MTVIGHCESLGEAVPVKSAAVNARRKLAFLETKSCLSPYPVPVASHCGLPDDLQCFFYVVPSHSEMFLTSRPVSCLDAFQ